MKRKTKTIRIEKPLHSLVKKHVQTTGMKLEKWVEKAIETALKDASAIP